MIKNKDIMLKIGEFPVITNKKTELVGIITDGDLRRMLLNIQKPFSAFFVDDVILHAKKNPITSTPEENVKKTLTKMNSFKVWDIPILKKNKLVGLVHLHPAVENLISRL